MCRFNFIIGARKPFFWEQIGLISFITHFITRSNARASANIVLSYMCMSCILVDYIPYHSTLFFSEFFIEDIWLK